MAHNLNVVNGKEAMAYQGATPWHNLGTQMSATANVQEAMIAASLNWNVELHPMFLKDGRQVIGRQAVLRDIDNKQIGTVGKDYEVRQNADAFGILDDACAKYGVTIESAGALGNGARVWMQAKMANSIQIDAVGGKDEVEGYFLIGARHDGGGAHFGKLTPQRVVCENTLNAAVDGQKLNELLFNIPHTKNADARLKEAKTLLDKMVEALHTTGQTFNALAKRTMTIDEIRAFIATVFPKPVEQETESKQLIEKRERVESLVYTGVGHELAGETAWGAYNAVTEYVDHIRPAAAKTPAGVLAASSSALFGSGELLKLAALRAARQFVYA